ncbi:uncharacterized protein H6S33_005141 [Morchella sextelata]|uniref:uncharacterized protein n=1 Tax=Morchella sextelata TaxID=1174677 RepID=UPI001D058064|nr:uncharacterized protein H6S33_005141 [Morchella sextelata]KAH0605159.1 hypothetical protein H6S33_005141 [Morchella sextelata]
MSDVIQDTLLQRLSEFLTTYGPLPADIDFGEELTEAHGLIADCLEALTKPLDTPAPLEPVIDTAPSAKNGFPQDEFRHPDAQIRLLPPRPRLLALGSRRMSRYFWPPVIRPQNVVHSELQLRNRSCDLISSSFESIYPTLVLCQMSPSSLPVKRRRWLNWEILVI